MLLRAGAPLLFASVLGAQPAPLPPLREQAAIEQAWLKSRLENVLPSLMRRHGVRMWLVICREYNEDPVYFSLASPEVMSARRRTILVFFDRGENLGVERLALGGGSHGGLYTVVRDPGLAGRETFLEAQWRLLRKVVEERKPDTIAVDISHTDAFADGLSMAEWESLSDALGPEWIRHIVRAERLPIEYLSVRVPEMLPYYRRMQEDAHALIRRAFSSEVITPGKTTDLDVIWWLREELRRQGFSTWFQPDLRIQKPGGPANTSVLADETGAVIEPGDVLHLDFGLTAMRLNTDTQHMGYVLRQGETEPPEAIRKALAATNRLQQIVLDAMKPGRLGDAVLASALERMRAEGINGLIYSHPVGDHGHGAGPLIGMWDLQQGVPGRGDMPILPNTWFSIELSTRTPISEWGGKELFIGLEEDAAIDANGRISWILNQQTQFHLVGAPQAVARRTDEWQPLFDGRSLGNWTETPFTGRGPVRVENGTIVLGTGEPMTGVNLTTPFPKSDYEVRFEAARLKGSDFFASLTFPIQDSYCTFVTGGWGGDIVGLSSLDGWDASDNETRTYVEFEPGRWYKFRLQVTGSHIKAWIDDQPTVNVAITGRTISLRPGEIKLSVPFGFAAYRTAGALRKIEYRRLGTP